MLFTSKELKGYKLGAKDGELGKVEEFYFDDKFWTLRYLVADTGGGWLKNHKVLISPYAFDSIDDFNHQILLNLTKKQIELSPSLKKDEPVSLQFEEAASQYYRWPRYWNGYYSWGSNPFIFNGKPPTQGMSKTHWDPHLRSTKEVAGYRLHAIDGEFGHIKDFIIEDNSWAIRYLVVDTGNWLSGKDVLISPSWIKNINSAQSIAFCTLSKEKIRNVPEYTEHALMSGTYETNLYAHYGLEGYWENEPNILKPKLVKKKSRPNERNLST